MRNNDTARPSRIMACVLSLGAGLSFIVTSLIVHDQHGGRVVRAASSPLALSNSDAQCQSCHREIYDRYERSTMARGSGLAVDGLDQTELTAKDLVHGPSGVTYHVSIREGKAYLSYGRPAVGGRPALDGEHQLDYFIGSGHRGRTFLYQQEGFWFEAPTNWYGKKQLWDMAPAYENSASMPDPLPVDPNCLHCHTGETQPTVGAARNHYAGSPFRSGGIGCAACHGDASAHLAGLRGEKQGKPGTGPIVNPDKLDPVRRDSACIQCHLEGDAAVYRPGKSLAQFQPGEVLSESVVYFIDSSKAQLGGRASSQYEALLRSACKRASGDMLTCTTCHDPHSSPLPEERVAFFRAKCLGCHTSSAIATKHHPEQQDCAVCHMPTRKSLDISHEQLTDHDIEKEPNTAMLTLTDLSHLHTAELVPVGNFVPGDRELGLAYAQLAHRGDRNAGERALKLLQAASKEGSVDAEVGDELGLMLQMSGLRSAASDQYLAVLKQRPQDVAAAANLAVLDASSGQTREAIRLLTQVVQDDPSQTSAGLNLAFIECRLDRKAEAIKMVQRMLVFNPDSPPAHRFLVTGSYGNQHCALR